MARFDVWQSLANGWWYWRAVDRNLPGLAAGRVHRTYWDAVREIRQLERMMGATIKVPIRRIYDPYAHLHARRFGVG